MTWLLLLRRQIVSEYWLLGQTSHNSTPQELLTHSFLKEKAQFWMAVPLSISFCPSHFSPGLLPRLQLFSLPPASPSSMHSPSFQGNSPHSGLHSVHLHSWKQLCGLSACCDDSDYLSLSSYLIYCLSPQELLPASKSALAFP